MQGRLSPLVDGKVQAFPWNHWREEFAAARELSLDLMEWTLDHARLSENPLMTVEGREAIAALSRRHGVEVGSLTGDVFMQAPFWRAHGDERRQRLRELDLIVDACSAAGIRLVVVPLVDNGALRSPAEEDLVVQALLERETHLRQSDVRIVFECDYEPLTLARFIERLPPRTFGINYDIGNSAALGYDCGVEIEAYGQRIMNVHIKDRVRGGTTVPLGTGNADLPRALRLLLARGYAGAFILQTARAQDGNHARALARYRDMSRSWLEHAAP